ncbi:MAG: hypothetical protein DHS20C01_14820 [marine bacterium B5-7]|nr:MAG: hypothetical protein DHS20C01_14820 [marine bacterium B5-7]
MKHKRATLGTSRVRGGIELIVWIAVAAIVVMAVWIEGTFSITSWVLVAVLLIALSPYIFKAVRALSGRGCLSADTGQRGFLRNGRLVVSFADVVALHTRMVNATCEEYELLAECGDDRQIVLYEGEPNNTDFRTIEKMAYIAGVPLHSRI